MIILLSCGFVFFERYLAEEDPSPEYVAFMEEQGITQSFHKLKGNKEPFDFIPKSVIATALVTVLGLISLFLFILLFYHLKISDLVILYVYTM
jgi:hypothetical protein